MQPIPPATDEMTLTVHKENLERSIVEFNDFIKKYTTELEELTGVLRPVADRGDAQSVLELAGATTLSEQTRQRVIHDLASHLITEHLAPEGAAIDDWAELGSVPGAARWITEEASDEVRAWAETLCKEATALSNWATMKGTTWLPGLRSAWLLEVRRAVEPAVDEMNKLFAMLPEVDQRISELLAQAQSSRSSGTRSPSLRKVGGSGRAKPMSANDVPRGLTAFWEDPRSRVPCPKLDGRTPLQRFLEYCEHRHVTENWEFLMQFFESGSTVPQANFPTTMTQAQSMDDTFISPDAISQVNIDSQLTNRLEQVLAKRDLAGTRRVLARTFESVWHLLNDDVYRPFSVELR